MNNDQKLDNLINKALLFATEKHKDQRRLDGQFYITHPVIVANNVTDPKAKIVALLHDTLEDTNTTFDELYHEFGSQITHAVALLSKHEIMPYKTYINNIKISNDPLAIAVKIADLKHNLSTIDNVPDLKKRESLRKRYMKALRVLDK